MSALKIYTCTGDQGETSLVGGARVSKADLQLDVYGTIDELNSHIGLIISYDIPEKEKADLLKVQYALFLVGTVFATPTDKLKENVYVKKDDIAFLEEKIDLMDKNLPKLNNFILPGGSVVASQCHIARTICRRAERLAVKSSKKQQEEAMSIAYLNRLSDYLFVLARYMNMYFGVEDIVISKQ